MDAEQIKDRLGELAPRYKQLAELKHKLHGQEAMRALLETLIDNTKRDVNELQRMLADSVQLITDEASGVGTLDGKREAYELARKTMRESVSSKVE